MQMIDSTHIKAHRSAAGGKRMARPVRKWFFCSWHKQSAQTYPAFSYAGPRWRSARSAPHKGDGIEVPFSAVGLQNADRLSGHLSLNHPQTSLVGCERRRPVVDQIVFARGSNVVP
jgi:hypothetical protein